MATGIIIPAARPFNNRTAVSVYSLWAKRYRSEITARSTSPDAMKILLPYLSDSPPIIGITIAREMAKPENIRPIQTPVTLRSSAMVGNRGEIILNPNIAAKIEKYRVNIVRFSISLHQTLQYKKLSVKMALLPKSEKVTTLGAGGIV
jgi:hypothetical protein